jgi:hypothetical protein
MEEEEVEVVFFLFSNDVINPKPESAGEKYYKG